MLTISQIRDEIYWKISDRLMENKSSDVNVVVLPYYELTSNEYIKIWLEIQSRFSNSFGGPQINGANILAMLSTSILELGKSGIVITTEGVYFIPWTVFGTANGYYWSHDEVYRNRQIGVHADEIGDIYNMSNVFDPYEMVDIMNDIVVISTSMRRKNMVERKALLTACGSAVAELGSIIQKVSTEYKLTEGLLELVDILGGCIQKEWHFSVIRSFNAVQDEIRNNALNLLKGMEEKAQKALISYNTQDSWYGQMLVWGGLFSLLAVDSCIHKNVVANSLVEGFHETFNLPKLQLSEEIREYMCKTMEDAKAKECVMDMIQGTVELYMNWETVGEIEILKCCVSIAAGIPYVLDGFLRGMDELVEQERCDFFEEVYWRGSPRYYPGCTEIREKSDKKLFKCLMEVQKKLDKKGMSACVHTINGASDDMISFMERLLKKIYVKSRFSYHFPMLMIRLNDFFASGIVFYKDLVIVHYLKGSPEYEIFAPEEKEEDLLDKIDVKSIHAITYCENHKFTTLLLVSAEGDIMYDLPVTMLPVEYAPILCNCISDLYESVGINIEVIGPKKDNPKWAEKVNGIYDTMCGRDNVKTETDRGNILKHLFKIK